MRDADADVSEANPESVQARLAALRAAGAWRADPMRFRALEKLAERMHGQPEPVRRQLQCRLTAALDELVASPTPVAAGVPSPVIAGSTRNPGGPQGTHTQHSGTGRQTPASPSPRARLRALSHSAGAPPSLATRELASARRFRQAWIGLRAADRVDQALARRPRNAGPLNSHALVLQTLATLQAISPGYVRRIVDLVETLDWLERAGERPAGTARRKPATSAAAKRRS